MELRRTLCLYHPQQYITNFCREKTCLMPLCPTCIRDHAQYHLESSLKPQYFNINETVAEVYNLLVSSINNLQQDKKRNVQLIKEIQGMDTIIKQKVLNAKKYILQLIDLSFQELEDTLIEAMNRINQENGLHCLKKAEKVNDKVSNTLNDLYSLLQGLKTEKVMASLIVFLKDKQPQASALHNSMLSYLDKNEAYEPKIQFSNQAKNNIQYNVGRLIKIEVKGQHSKHREKSYEVKSIFKSRVNKKEVSQRSEKLQRAYTPQKSTVYTKSNVEDYRPINNNSKNYSKNSPYRERFDLTLKPSQAVNSSYFNQVYQSYKINSPNSEMQTSPKKYSYARKQNEAVYKHNI